MLDDITPVVLTWNEAPNIGRCLSRLSWAREIVVVDSHSDDGTPEIARSFDNVRFYSRRFDTHARQWDFAIHGTAITSGWILRLDADYIVTERLEGDLRALSPDEVVDGYEVRFVYCIGGRPLRASLYRPGIRLFRRGRCRIINAGHTERIEPAGGRVGQLPGPMLHDDRKGLDRFVEAQRRYMRLEAVKLRAAGWRELDFTDRVRRLRWLAPLLILPHCLLAKGLILDGRAGVFYAFQRLLAELLLSLYLIALDLGLEPDAGTPNSAEKV